MSNFDWVLNERRPYSDLSLIEQELFNNRGKVVILGGVSDDTLSYEYDEWALCFYKNNYYWFSTSGCSCPHPNETWRIEIGPCSIQEIKDIFLNGDYKGFTPDKEHYQEWLNLLDKYLFQYKVKEELNKG